MDPPCSSAVGRHGQKFGPWPWLSCERRRVAGVRPSDNQFVSFHTFRINFNRKAPVVNNQIHNFDIFWKLPTAAVCPAGRHRPAAPKQRRLGPAGSQHLFDQAARDAPRWKQWATNDVFIKSQYWMYTIRFLVAQQLYMSCFFFLFYVLSILHTNSQVHIQTHKPEQNQYN